MAITFRSKTTDAVNDETSSPHNIVLAKPSGVIDDDLLLAFIQTQGNVSFDFVPTGWELLHSIVTPTTTNSGCRMAVYYRVADSEPSTYTWSMSAAAIYAACILAYIGVDPADPIDSSASSANDDDQNTAIVAPSCSPLESNSMLVTGHACNPNIQQALEVDFSTPSGMFQHFDSNQTWDGTTLRTGLAVFDEQLDSSGATGTRTSNCSDDGRSCTASVALKAAEGGGGGGQPQTITISAGGGAISQVMYGWHDTNTSEARDVEDSLGKHFAVFRHFQDTKLGLPQQAAEDMAEGVDKTTTSISYIAEEHINPAKGSASITVTVPAAADAGDLLLAVVHTDYCNLGSNTPAGWTLLTRREEDYGPGGVNPGNIPELHGGTDLCGYVFYKVSDGTEVNATFTPDEEEGDGEDNVFTGTIMVFRGVDTAAPILDYTWNESTSGDQIDSPSASGRNGGMLVCAFIQDDSDDLLTPSGMTLVSEVPTVPSDDRVLIAYKALVSDASTGTQTSFNVAPTGQTPNDMAVSVSLKPAGSRLVLWSVKADDWGSVGSGGQDAWINNVGAELQSWAVPWVVFIFYHEPGSNADDPTRTPAKYNAAWQRIYDIWHAAGYLYRDGDGGKILLGYCEIKHGNAWPLEDDPLWTDASGTLPEVIDILCHDDYNEIHSSDGVVSNQLFGHEDIDSVSGDVGECWYAMLEICEQVQKPLIIGEFGSVPGDDNAVHNDAGFSTDLKNALIALGFEGNRDGWFDQAAHFIKTNDLAQRWLRGFNYYHSRGWVFLNADGSGTHPTGEGGGGGQTEILEGGPPGGVEGRDGWIRSFVEDDYFTDIPFDPLNPPTEGSQGGGIPSAEAFGVPSLALGTGTQGFQPTGIASAEAIGVPTLALVPTPRGPTSVTLLDSGLTSVELLDDGVTGIEVL